MLFYFCRPFEIVLSHTMCPSAVVRYGGLCDTVASILPHCLTGGPIQHYGSDVDDGWPRHYKQYSSSTCDVYIMTVFVCGIFVCVCVPNCLANIGATAQVTVAVSMTIILVCHPHLRRYRVTVSARRWMRAVRERGCLAAQCRSRTLMSGRRFVVEACVCVCVCVRVCVL